MKLTPGKISRVLAIIVSSLLGLHLLTLIARHGFGRRYMHGMLEMFSLDEERNIPTLYSVLVILSCAVIAWMISMQATEHRKKLSSLWKCFSVFIFFLALDEAFSIHELANRKQVADFIPSGNGFFYYTWVVPYFFLVLLAATFFWKFIMKLPVMTRNRFIIAAAIYVCGALGMELLGGKYRSINGNDAYYYIIVAAEEVLEMAAMIVFVNALLRYYLSTQPNERMAIRINLSQTEVVDQQIGFHDVAAKSDLVTHTTKYPLIKSADQTTSRL